jgi:hypothetical protein
MSSKNQKSVQTITTSPKKSSELLSSKKVEVSTPSTDLNTESISVSSKEIVRKRPLTLPKKSNISKREEREEEIVEQQIEEEKVSISSTKYERSVSPTKRSVSSSRKIKEETRRKSSSESEDIPLPTMSKSKMEKESPTLINVPEEKVSPLLEEEREITKKHISSKIQPPSLAIPKHTLKNVDRVVYVIVKVISSLFLQEIIDFFEALTTTIVNDKPLVDPKGLPVVGCARVEHRRMRPEAGRQYFDDWDQYTETNYNILCIHPDAVNLLKTSDAYWITKSNRSGANGIAIQQYLIRETNYPPPTCASALYCSFKDPRIIPVKESIKQMHMKMANMVECGLVEEDQYQIHVPQISREEGLHRNFCIITFKDEVELDRRAMIKTCLDQTKFRGAYDEEIKKFVPSMCRIAWANKRIMPIIERMKSRRIREFSESREEGEEKRRTRSHSRPRSLSRGKEEETERRSRGEGEKQSKREEIERKPRGERRSRGEAELITFEELPKQSFVKRPLKKKVEEEEEPEKKETSKSTVRPSRQTKKIEVTEEKKETSKPIVRPSRQTKKIEVVEEGEEETEKKETSKSKTTVRPSKQPEEEEEEEFNKPKRTSRPVLPVKKSVLKIKKASESEFE